MSLEKLGRDEEAKKLLKEIAEEGLNNFEDPDMYTDMSGISDYTLWDSIHAYEKLEDADNLNKCLKLALDYYLHQSKVGENEMGEIQYVVSDINPYYDIAIIYEKLGDKENAKRAYQNYVQLGVNLAQKNDENPSLYMESMQELFRQAVVAEKIDDLENKLYLLKKITTMNTGEMERDDSGNLETRSYAFLKLGDKEKAKKYLLQAIENANSYDKYSHQACLYEELEKMD